MFGFFRTYPVLEDGPIGQGAFSTVYKATWKTQKVAVKRLSVRDDGDYTKETKILSKLSHPNIVKCYDFYRNRQGTRDIILELACGGTLAGALYVPNLSMSWKLSTICQMAAAVVYLHDRGILHLDLKPPNILFKDKSRTHVLIADFGTATQADQAYHAGARKFKARDYPYTHKSDVFSLASISCCVLSGRNPEDPEETKYIVSQVLRRGDLMSCLRRVLQRGTDPNHINRPSARQFLHEFQRRRSFFGGLSRIFESVINLFKAFFIIVLVMAIFIEILENSAPGATRA